MERKYSFEGAELLSAHACDIEDHLWHANMPNVRISSREFRDRDVITFTREATFSVVGFASQKVLP
jgi:hypothetical protein